MKPPEAIEIERAVLGAVLLDQNSLTDVIGILKPEMFFEKRNAEIFEAMTELYSNNDGIDTLTVYEKTKKDADYLAKLTQDISSSANIEYHAKIIIEKFILRQVIKTSAEMTSSAMGESDPFEILGKAEDQIFQIGQGLYTNEPRSLAQTTKETLTEIEAILKGSKPGIQTGYKDIDELLTLRPTDLVVLAARPGMGKSALALSIAKNSGVPSLIFSLEMDALQLNMRLLASESGIPLWRLVRGKINQDEAAPLSRSGYNVSQLPIYIDDTPQIDILQLKSKAKRLKAQKDIKFILVDYLQLMKGAGRSRDEEVGHLTRSLKGLAKELKLPVMVLSQLNRGVESRTDKRPMLQDLRESGSIEQDADAVLFLYRPEYYKLGEEGLAELIIAKQRQGATGDTKLTFVKETTEFKDYSEYKEPF